MPAGPPRRPFDRLGHPRPLPARARAWRASTRRSTSSTPRQGHDNAKLVVEATYGTGDVDLYLQRELADGHVVATTSPTGASSSLSGEQLSSGRLEPGH